MIPFGLLYPAILMFICIGVYAIDNSVFDVWMVAVIGGFGWLARSRTSRPRRCSSGSCSGRRWRSTSGGR